MIGVNSLQNVEGHCKAICLALHITEAQHLTIDTDERRKTLVRMTIKALQGLMGGDAGGGLPARPSYEAGPGSPSNALSMDVGDLSDQDRLDRVANALTHLMGAAYVPPERRYVPPKRR